MAERNHTFLFQPGIWIGEGDVAFSGSKDKVHFFTKWVIFEEREGEISCHQIVEIQGVEDHVNNRFTISSLDGAHFEILLENELMSCVTGKGLIDSLKIGWEFRQRDNFDGFEVYELLEGGRYKMHAEYASSDQFRTIIDGVIWPTD